jgi:DNA-binding PadR family transcriptional regulator
MAERKKASRRQLRGELLHTTAYAILGLLALRPMSAYELAAEVQHCFEYFWPRADVRVYEEAKELVATGHVRAKKEFVGRRRRTSYTITAKGRRALEQWLVWPSQAVSLEFEGLLKVYLARFGTREQLLATLDRTLADAEYMLQVATNVRQVYLECRAPFQEEQGHIWAFIYDFLVAYMQMIHAWAERTKAEVERWADLTPEGKRERALQLFEQTIPAAWLSPTPSSVADEVPPYPGMWRRRQSASS